MISKFGLYVRKIREDNNESLRQMAVKLGVSAAFLSAMEVGRKTIPIDYVSKIKDVYSLNDEQIIELENSIYETNERVPLELKTMNDAQKDVSLMFARKIKNADENMLKKLKEALSNEED